MVEKNFDREMVKKDIKIEELMGTILEKDKVIALGEVVGRNMGKKIAGLVYDAKVSRKGLEFGMEVRRILEEKNKALRRSWN